MKKRSINISLLLLTGAILLSCSALPVTIHASSADPTIINVDASTKRGETSPYTLGANHRHAYGGFGMYDTEGLEVYPDFLEKTSDAKLGVVRYPGGTIANLFTWKDTVGPIEERRNVVLGNSYQSVFPYYGLDEHMQYTEAIGAEVIYMVGEAAETPEGAADLVEYLNGIPGENKNGGIDWAQKRADNGHPEPYGVVYFEIGNEMYLDNQQYWLNYPSALEDTDRARRYMQGDTVTVTGSVARRYGTWTDNVSDGEANEEFYTQYNPTVEGSDKVYVNGEAWTRVTSFEGSSSTDKVYTYEPKTGKITFGDGVNGMIPEKGAKIKVDYLHIHAGFTEYYDAMKAVDPDIKIFANLPWAFNFVEGTKCDGIVYHNYFTYSNTLKNAEELHDAYMKMADNLVLSIDNNVSQLRERTKRQDTIAAVTEFGSIDNAAIYSQDKSEYGRDEARSLSRALSFATTYMGSRKAESLIHIHQAFTAYSFGGGERLPNADFVYNSLYAPTKENPAEFIETGTALAYKLIGNNVADSYRNSYVLNNPITGSRIAKYEALVTSVTVDDETGDLYLMVVNRDSDKDITSIINLNGYTITGEARIQTLNGADIASCNTPDHPNDITITESSASLGVGGSAFKYTFPAHSVVAIKLSGKVSSEYKSDLSESFNEVEAGKIPELISVSGNATVTELEEGKVLSLSRKGSNVTVTLPLSATEGSVNGISRIRLRVRAEQSGAARIQFVLKNEKGETMMLAMEGGFVKNDGKIRAVYTAGRFHDIEIAIDHGSGQYVIYFDGSYIGSPGKLTPSENGSQQIVVSAMTANGTFYIDDYSVDSLDSAVSVEDFDIGNEGESDGGGDSDQGSGNPDGESGDQPNEDGTDQSDGKDNENTLNSLIVIGISAASVVLLGAGVVCVIIVSKRKRQ